ncbi:MAG: PQQ-binding-like beta-propeller repeat protein [Kofleriaceae bacterium]
MARPPLVITAFNNRVFGLDRDTGAIRWRVETGDMLTNPIELAIDDTTVIACTAFHLVFIDYLTGQVRQKVERTDKAKGARPLMVLSDGHFYIAGSGVLTCYSAAGNHLWNQAFKGEGYGEVSFGVPHLVRQADEKG